MNLKEYLLTCAIEECNELAQELAKALRFTENDICPHNGLSCKENIRVEANDLYGVLEMLVEFGINVVPDRELMTAKQERVNKIMQHSRKMGALEP